MVVATSDGQKTYVTNGADGGVIYALSTDADGSNLTGLGGDDSLRGNKYWSPVGRVDNVYGDRNLVCACPPMSDYEQA